MVVVLKSSRFVVAFCLFLLVAWCGVFYNILSGISDEPVFVEPHEVAAEVTDDQKVQFVEACKGLFYYELFTVPEA